MKYSHFETLVLVVVGVAIGSTVFLSLRDGHAFEEIVAQVLLFTTLVGAMHWGRRGGFIAASIASVAYLALRIPTVGALGGISAEIAMLVLIRLAAFGAVGIIGGEVCSRIQYLFARLENSGAIDEWTGLYNQRTFTRHLSAARGRSDRYGEPFSVVMVDLNPALTAGLRAGKQRTLMRAVGQRIRGDIRLVDEVARLDDGTFAILLPHTPKEGGDVVARRLSDRVCDTLGARPEAITVTLLGHAEDREDIAGLLAELQPPAPLGFDQIEPSGA